MEKFVISVRRGFGKNRKHREIRLVYKMKYAIIAIAAVENSFF